MTEHVLLVAGPMGAGKTTAIESLSEIEVVRTEATNTDCETVDKPTTTVALDYGELTLSDDEKIRLYGIPGQRRFDFMWAILKDRAEGLVLLVNNDAPDPIALALEYLLEFRSLHEQGGVVVTVTRTDVSAHPTLDEYAHAFAAEYPDTVIPLFTVDARNAEHLRSALMCLVANLDACASTEMAVEA